MDLPPMKSNQTPSTKGAAKRKPKAPKSTTRKPRTRDVKPSEMQALALQYVTEGMSKKQAMLKAGYSESSARTSSIFKKKGVQNLIDQQRALYIKKGITPEFISEKMKEWLTAEKVQFDKEGLAYHEPDYQTQLKAFTEYKQDMGMGKQSINVQQNNQYNIGALYDEFEEEDEVEVLEGELADGISSDE